ncbi:TPA: RNA methyltransferase [Candidatus Poribacteria bacterium]|nr:RNA methyltransferase [Candidatus Poribacteria bacterium]
MYADIKEDLSVQKTRALQVDMPSNLDNIRIILVEPQIPGNIGSTARVMKGMGLSQLVLVNPAPWRDAPDSWRMACSSTDILGNSSVVSTLEEALEGVHYLVGTTHRKRADILPQAITPRETGEKIAAVSQNKVVGLLFGREDKGLTTENLSLCQIYSSIPMARKNPSLNLSHAVMVFAYEILMASLTEIPPERLDLAEISEIERFYQRVAKLMARVGFAPYNDDWNTLLYALRRVFGRVSLEKRDLNTLYLIFAEIDRYITRAIEKPIF